MKTLTFIRHAESVANAGGITMPHAAIPLSPLGELQARALLTAEMYLDPSAIFTSSMVRTQQTAAPLCERAGIPYQVDSRLDEFSVIDPALIAGMDGAQRKPFVKAYWDEANPRRRLGEHADTFAEFTSRVTKFRIALSDLPDQAVIFCHGIWFSMLVWQTLGFDANGSDGMRTFRRFQAALPMPNCALFGMARASNQQWSVRADTGMARHIAATRLIAQSREGDR